MRKEYRDIIIGGIGGILSGGTVLYLNQGKYSWDPWRFIITYSIFHAFAHLIGGILRERREAKKEEAVQRRE